MSSSRCQARTTEANASLISTTSMSWSRSSPARASTRRVAGIGAVSIRMGESPARANDTNRARGVRPSSSAFSREAISTAAAPSEIWLELPAVTVQWSWSGNICSKCGAWNAGWSVRIRSRSGSMRMPSSKSRSVCSPSGPATFIGRISRLKYPPLVAAAAWTCER